MLCERSASKVFAKKCKENKRYTAGYTGQRRGFCNAISLKETNLVLDFSDVTERYGIQHYQFMYVIFSKKNNIKLHLLKKEQHKIAHKCFMLLYRSKSNCFFIFNGSFRSIIHHDKSAVMLKGSRRFRVDNKKIFYSKVKR